MKIKSLKLYTSNLSKQVKFYSTKIGLKIIEQSATQAKFRMGNSIFTLIENKDFKPYHFAINIPSNQEKEALNWLKSRVEILKDEDHEIQDFDFWNAKAIYFYDPDKNIVELIARKNLSNESQEAFSSNSLLEISEIGVPVSDVESTYKALKEIAEIPIYSGGFERFLAVGGEQGLFICINKNIKKWFPTGDEAYSSPFEATIESNGAEHELEFIKEKLKSSSKST